MKRCCSQRTDLRPAVSSRLTHDTHMKTIAWIDVEGRAIAPPRHGHTDLKNERQWMASRADDIALVKRATADDLLWALTDLINAISKHHANFDDALDRAIVARDNAEAE